MRTLRYYARDVFRGPFAETDFGYFVSSLGGGFLVGLLIALAFL